MRSTVLAQRNEERRTRALTWTRVAFCHSVSVTTNSCIEHDKRSIRVCADNDSNCGSFESAANCQRKQFPLIYQFISDYLWAEPVDNSTSCFGDNQFYNLVQNYIDKGSYTVFESKSGHYKYFTSHGQDFATNKSKTFNQPKGTRKKMVLLRQQN